MKVVNLKREPYTVYIGRAGHGLDGYWGNPIKLNTKCQECGETHETRGSTLPCYETYLVRKLETSSVFRERFLMLSEDDVLGCFCRPDECHGDVMMRVWNELQKA